MEENTNTNANAAAAAESLIDSIKKLMDAVGNDEELKGKLGEALAALTGKNSPRGEDTEKQDPPEKAPADEAEEEDEENEAEAEDGEDAAAVSSSCSDLSDIFTEDAVAGMVVGFIAGAAVVGGGVLLHKVLSDN